MKLTVETLEIVTVIETEIMIEIVNLTMNEIVTEVVNEAETAQEVGTEERFVHKTNHVVKC